MDYLFLFLLFLIAFLYSSVGHGGGSGYLALMALYGILPEFMKPTALTLNVFVAGIAFFSYYKAGFFRLKLVLPFVISSVPMAFAGALVKVNPTAYKIILGIFLLIAISRILFVPKSLVEEASKPPAWLALLIGAVLGFFSGMIGIGGGIILSPLLLLLHWANMKETAAASAFFILLNSISGLTALKISGFHFQSQLIVWVIVGILGGILGSYSGSFRIKPVYLKFPLAVVLLIASLKLFFV
jgi:uncharacterized protein